MENFVGDPFEPAFLGELGLRERAEAPKVARLSRVELVELASEVARRRVTVGEAPAMELTARHPFDGAGFMDVYRPGRWDCEANLVFMSVIVSTGESPGMWDGTVVYARFQAPAAGTYLVVGNFSGYQVTMNLNGPWGKNTAYCATTSDHVAASALWTGAAGETLFFTMNCTGPILGYLESVQVFLVS